MTDAITRATEALLLQRRTHKAAGVLPELTEAEAYAVQARVASNLGERVEGWKVAIVAGRPVAAPLFACRQTAALHATGPLKIETEIALTLAYDIPSGPLTRARLLGAVGLVHAAFELVSPRFGEPPEVPFTGFLADNLGNAAKVLGEGVPWHDWDHLPDRGWIDRNGIRLAEGPHLQGDPLAALLAYAAEQPDALGGLRAGQVILTGSFTGAIQVSGTASYIGGFDGLLPVEFVFTDKGDG